jgi:Protein of unknwon function (DUF3310)
MGANERQIGGLHYKTEYEHWDLAVVVQLPYLEGCATKYVSRWRKKDGLQDLEKALHYHDKILETALCTWSPRAMKVKEITDEVERFVKANKLTPAEHEYIHLMCVYRTTIELELARNVLVGLIDVVKATDQAVDVIVGMVKQEESRALPEPNRPGTPDDGGHHEQGPKEKG